VHHLDCDEGSRHFLAALRSDVDDLQGGTTAEGIHLGAMAGTLGIVFRHYAGVDLSPDGVAFDPALPGRVRRIGFRVQWRGRWVDVDVSRERLGVRVDPDHGDAVPVRVGGEAHRVLPGGRLDVPLTDGHPCR
jgi:trehalose/maltose hydrolase-like predicted phosphorylase